MTEFTATEKHACAERELKLRRRVYPRLVAQKKMTQSLANHEIFCMEEISADYRAQSEKEKLL